MPRYYFHIRKGDVLTADPEGTDVSEAESLRRPSRLRETSWLMVTFRAWIGVDGSMKSRMRPARRC